MRLRLRPRKGKEREREKEKEKVDNQGTDYKPKRLVKRKIKYLGQKKMKRGILNETNKKDLEFISSTILNDWN